MAKQTKHNTQKHTTRAHKVKPAMRSRTQFAVKAIFLVGCFSKVVIVVILGLIFISLRTTAFLFVFAFGTDLFVSFFALACSELGRYLFALEFCVNLLGRAAERIKIVCIEFEPVCLVSAAVPCLFPETMSWHKNTKPSKNKNSFCRSETKKSYESFIAATCQFCRHR